MKKIFISCILLLCAVCVMLPATSYAEAAVQEPAAMAGSLMTGNTQDDEITPSATSRSVAAVAKVNKVSYKSVQEAIDAATAGNTVSLCIDSVEETIYIDKNITLDLKGAVLWTDEETDVIVVENASPVIKNGTVKNISNIAGSSAIAVYGESPNVKITSVKAYSVANNSDTILLDSGTSAVITGGYIGYDTKYSSSKKSITACHVAKGATCTIKNGNLRVAYGDALYIDGKVVLTDCYAMSKQDNHSAIVVDANGIVTINSGYYYGHPAMRINAIWKDPGKVVVNEGQFVSKYEDSPAIYGEKNSHEEKISIGSGRTVTPKNWKTSTYADNICVYKNISAPETVSVNLTAEKGSAEGYNDIKITWSKVSAADGYSVSYKKGTGSYINSKTYKKSATRARKVFNLSSGSKYTAKVTPYILINEKILSNGGTKCYSTKYRTAYTYTLKEISVSKISKSDGKVKIAWKNIPGETGYQISKASKEKGTSIIGTYKSTNLKSKLVTADKGKTYWYKVRAYKVVGKNSKGKPIYVYGQWSKPKSFKR